ncbi:FAD-binding and (Fe-S)-binding domain-containing protein [Rhodococcus pyridinivorans]|uniref:FAD-binding and (Fe-S)-binding domain-containing protein n=1 Tax=Rhodococcus pyridinivorans TaxID=103816 RepID=UPI000F0E597F|nr:FAD-binding and (Fe-S)-binding domain-containing protein [Rhodococcus pyridinivorans]
MNDDQLDIGQRPSVSCTDEDVRIRVLADRLRTLGVPVDTSTRRRAEYSYDASNYRVPPSAVVFPRSVDDVVAVVTVCGDTGIPLVSRGGGTSMAGNAVGPGVIVDFSRHMNRILEIDETAGVADVEPGVVLATLTRVAEDASSGRTTFAPDPSSKNRATVGGALGNDACGNHSVRYGRMSDHVHEIDLVTADGFRLTAAQQGLRATDPDDAAAAARAQQLDAELTALAGEHLFEFRTELGRIQRQVSGYHLDHLLPEKRFDVARALVGSEGTCAVIVGARVELVPRPSSALLVCLGYDDVVDAARDIGTILEFSPAAVEGVDAAIVETMRLRRGENSVLGLPVGNAWLYVDLDGDDPDSVAAAADALLDKLRRNGRLVDGRVAADTTERASLWRVREDGAGLSSRLASGGESWPGWEDSAVAPENLADYLEDFRALLDRHGLQGVMYGHFGAGCMHIRITYDLRTEEGRQVFREFTHEAARLVVRHGGSLSGEHGDGRARSELLPVMYSARMMSAFRAFRTIWDPQGILNPGSLTDPARIDDDLALADVPERTWRTHYDLHPIEAVRPDGARPQHTPAPWVHAVQGCIGVGRCRADSGGVMCPSYRATRDEKDSTRGRARVLQEMVRGARTIEQGWKSEEVREALDLCLSCKACSTDCPAGVDMATYKSEFFSHYYDSTRRPVSHYSLGWLPRWLRLTGLAAPLVNAVLRTSLAKRAAALGGISPDRVFPPFASRRAWKKAVRDALRGRSGSTPVVLFVDTFTRGLRPGVAGAAARVLASADQRVMSCSADACCGLTWISTGQLDTAKKKLSHAARTLDDGTDRPIVVVEPSCAAALRKDLPELVPTEAARRVAARVHSFASYLDTMVRNGWTPAPAQPLPHEIVLQTHCHEYSVFGAGSHRRILTAAGVDDVRDAVGCCGVAGNFGFEKQHHDISMKVAETSLAPALRAADDDSAVVTDGFSCAMQVAQIDVSAPGQHLAELLDPGPRMSMNNNISEEESA